VALARSGSQDLQKVISTALVFGIPGLFAVLARKRVCIYLPFWHRSVCVCVCVCG